MEKVSRELSRVQSSHWLVSGYSGLWGVAIRGCIYILSIHVMWRHYKNSVTHHHHQQHLHHLNRTLVVTLFYAFLRSYHEFFIEFSRRLLVFVCNAEREKQTEVYLL